MATQGRQGGRQVPYRPGGLTSRATVNRPLDRLAGDRLKFVHPQGSSRSGPPPAGGARQQTWPSGHGVCSRSKARQRVFLERPDETCGTDIRPAFGRVLPMGGRR